MTAPIKPPSTGWANIDADPVCRNWRQDTDGAQREMGTRYHAAVELAQRYNYLAAKHPITLFDAVQAPSDVVSDGRNPLYEWRRSANIDNARRYVVHIIAAPKVSNLGIMANAHRSGTTSGQTTSDQNYVAAVGGINRYYDAYYDAFGSNEPHTAVGTLATDAIVTEGGYTIWDMAVQVMSIHTLVPGTHRVCNPFLAKGERPVLNDALEQVRTEFERLRRTQLPRVGSWSAQGLPGIQIEASATTRNNVFATSSSGATARTATTPGPTFMCYRAGIGPEGSDYGKRVPILCRLKCAYNGSAAINVCFEGPTHVSPNAVNIQVGGPSGQQWRTAESVIYGNPQDDGSWVNTDRNKIDLILEPGSGTLGTINIAGFYMEFVDPTLVL